MGYAEVFIRGHNFNPEVLTTSVEATGSWISKDGEQYTVTSDIPGLFNGTIDLLALSVIPSPSVGTLSTIVESTAKWG